MILKGNQRGGGQQLAAHLMNSFDNESVEIADVRGAVAQDLSGAFAEWSAQGRATKIEKKYYYSLSLNPDPAQGPLTREQYFDLIARTERSLKLVGQPRAVVFHVKEGREHGHVVWSRVDTTGDKVKAIHIAHDRLKLRTVNRQFCRDHGLELPERMRPAKNKDSRSDVFNDRAENLGERQQRERSGITTQQRKSDIAACWKETSNGAAFVHAMQVKGYYLAHGDKRDYVVLDLHGEVHSLSRQLSGVVRKKELVQRLAAYPPDKQPGVEKIRDFLQQKRQDAIRKAVAQKEVTGPTDIEKRREALKAHQHQLRADLDHMRTNLIGRHASEREGLMAAQQAQNTGIVSARLQKQPKGFMAFLTRVTGIKLVIEVRQKQQDKARAAEHKQQTDALQRTHGRELHEIDRRYRALDQQEARENRSVETALKREQFQLFVLKKPPQRVLKPEFDRAAGIREATGSAGSGELSAKFRHQAQDSGVRKGELQAAFERATSGKTKPAGDAGSGPAPADTEKLDEARRTRDEFRRRQPRPGPDRDRDRER
jgi:hypothetical protein